jgi:hypothetical protein
LLDLDISIAAATPMEEEGAMRILDACAARFIGSHIVAVLIVLAIDERGEKSQ